MSDMSRTEIIDILLNEMECVQRASDDECNRDCAKCDLLRDTDKILQAYRIAIRALEHPEENVVKVIPHGDVISRQAVLKTLDDMNNVLDEDRTIENYKELLKECYEVLPSVNPQEPKTGHWIYDRTRDWDGECKYECSECGMGSDVDYAYCMRCGAKMVEPQESEG